MLREVSGLEEVLEIISYCSFSTWGNWSPTKFAVIMAQGHPNSRFRVVEVKQCPQGFFSVIPVGTGPVLMGLFLGLLGHCQLQQGES